MQPRLPELHDFAAHYTAAWCSQNPQRVAAFFSPDGSLRVNDDPAALGRAAITQVAQSFMTAFPDLSVTRIPGRAGLGAGSASAVLKRGGLGVTV